MEIEIVEESDTSILSKTQKQKIRRLVHECWVSVDDFYDKMDDILAQIHYEPNATPYNHIDPNLHSGHRLVLTFKHVHMETMEERRKLLRQKLRDAIDYKKRPTANQDPHEQLYKKICRLLPEEQRRIVPSPQQVRDNRDTYKQMMTMLPAQNPLRHYLSSLLST